MVMTQKNKGCHYNKLTSGVHEFIFTGEGEDGLDYFFDTLTGIIAEAPMNTTLRYLVDVTPLDGRGSLAELVKRFRKLEAQFPERAKGRTAIIHNPNLLITFVNTFITTLAPGQDKTRFFVNTKREEALNWVLSDD